MDVRLGRDVVLEESATRHCSKAGVDQRCQRAIGDIEERVERSERLLEDGQVIGQGGSEDEYERRHAFDERHHNAEQETMRDVLAFCVRAALRLRNETVCFRPRPDPIGLGVCLITLKRLTGVSV